MEIWIGRGSGAEPHEDSEIMEKLFEKSMETGKILKSSWIFSEFWFEKANFNKDLGEFDGFENPYYF